MRTLLAAALASIIPATALAQTTTAPSTTAIDVQNLWPAAGPQQSVALRSSDVQPHLSVGFALLANFMYRPLVFTEVASGATHDAVQYGLTTDFVWGLGLFDRLEIGVAIPLVVSQSGEGISSLVPNGGPATQLPQTALRDLRFDIGYAVIQRPRRTNADGFGLRFDLGGAAPIGDHGDFQGASSWTFDALGIADYRFSGFTVTVNAGVRVRDSAAVADVVWGNQLVLGAGIAYRPPSLDRLSVGIDYLALVPLIGSLTLPAGVAGPTEQTYQPFTPMELFYGARYAVDRGRDIEVSLGGGAPLDSAPTVPQFRVMLGLSYMPHGYDNDGDGVPDADDACPAVPEDRDGFQDQDGCPDPDNDNDHVLDVNDRCPNDPEDVDNFQDEDGCPDPENDNDGVLDADDECSTEPAGDHPDPAHPGCPVRDRDHDGVLDTMDRCPDQPAGAYPDPTLPGCPMPDRDHDGVPDAEDQCPSDPAGAHADPYRAGCPDPDRDHDGVPNEIDRCPDEPETINGVTDDDGCPDEGDEGTHWAGNVIIFEHVIRLRPGARAITAADANVLTQAAQRIRGRGAAVARVDVQVVPAPGRAGEHEATRLAGLVADVLAAHGIARDSIDAGPVLPPAAAPGAAHPPRVSGTPGELRLRIVPRPIPHATAPSGAPSSSPSPASTAPTSEAPSASPSPATPAASASPVPAALPAASPTP